MRLLKRIVHPNNKTKESEEYDLPYLACLTLRASVIEGEDFDVDSRESVASNRLATLAVQYPAIHTHIYWYVSFPDSGEERSPCCRFPPYRTPMFFPAL